MVNAWHGYKIKLFVGASVSVVFGKHDDCLSVPQIDEIPHRDFKPNVVDWLVKYQPTVACILQQEKVILERNTMQSVTELLRHARTVSPFPRLKSVN